MAVGPQSIPSPLEQCKAAEAKLSRARDLLSESNPETLAEALEECRIELLSAVEFLRGIPGPVSSAEKEAVASLLLRLRSQARAIGVHARHTSNFCQGWLQRALGTGYTESGLPVLAEAGPRSSFEG